MFSTRKDSRARTRSVHLSLNSLESRDTPTGGFVGPLESPITATISTETPTTQTPVTPLPAQTAPVAPTPVGPTGPTTPANPINVAPVITSFSAVVGANGKVTFSGTVTDDTPVAGIQVAIAATDGSIALIATVQADGTFSASTTTTGNGGETIFVGAVAKDAAGASSGPAFTFFETSYNGPS